MHQWPELLRAILIPSFAASDEQRQNQLNGSNKKQYGYVHQFEHKIEL